MIKSTLSVLALVGTASLAMAMPGHGDGTARSSGCGMAPVGEHATGDTGHAMHGQQMGAMQTRRAQHMQQMHQMHGQGADHAPAMGRHAVPGATPGAAEKPTPKTPN